MSRDLKITAIVLAAGLSTRMGSPKMLLPWKGSTVLDTVLRTVTGCPFEDVILVYGAFSNDILEIAARYQLKPILNPNYRNGSMLVSLQTGLQALTDEMDGFMIILGDQPLLSSVVVDQLITDFHDHRAKLILPSYHMRRGHPWLIDISLKTEIMGLKEPGTLRDFLKSQDSEIYYSIVDDPGVLSDLDTPEDYQKLLAGC